MQQIARKPEERDALFQDIVADLNKLDPELLKRLSKRAWRLARRIKNAPEPGTKYIHLNVPADTVWYELMWELGELPKGDRPLGGITLSVLQDGQTDVIGAAFRSPLETSFDSERARVISDGRRRKRAARVRARRFGPEYYGEAAAAAYEALSDEHKPRWWPSQTVVLTKFSPAVEASDRAFGKQTARYLYGDLEPIDRRINWSAGVVSTVGFVASFVAAMGALAPGQSVLARIVGMTLAVAAFYVSMRLGNKFFESYDRTGHVG